MKLGDKPTHLMIVNPIPERNKSGRTDWRATDATQNRGAEVWFQSVVGCLKCLYGKELLIRRIGGFFNRYFPPLPRRP